LSINCALGDLSNSILNRLLHSVLTHTAAPKVQVNLGSLADMGKMFSQAWNQAAAGEQVDETNVTFLDVQTMLDTLSSRRLDPLRHVRKHGASNVMKSSQSG